jgi:hypothetical protein
VQLAGYKWLPGLQADELGIKFESLSAVSGMEWNGMEWNGMEWDIMSCHVKFCSALLCYILLCHVILCCVMCGLKSICMITSLL